MTVSHERGRPARGVRRDHRRATTGSSRATGCPRATARRWSARSPSTRTPRSSACSRRATGSPARRRCAARRSCWPRSRTRPATGSTSTPRARPSASPARELTEMLIDGAAEVLLDLQLPDAVVRRRRHHRLAGRRRRDLQPGAAVPHVVRPLRPGDDPDLQGGVLPPAAGLRAADDDDARHRRAARDGPGVGGPVLVAGADDVRPARRPSRPTPRSRWPGASSATPTTSCASGSST